MVAHSARIVGNLEANASTRSWLRNEVREKHKDSIGKSPLSGKLPKTRASSYETQMNVFTFDQYHLFRGKARVLPGFEQVPDKGPAAPQ